MMYLSTNSSFSVLRSKVKETPISDRPSFLSSSLRFYVRVHSRSDRRRGTYRDAVLSGSVSTEVEHSSPNRKACGGYSTVSNR